MIAWKLGIAEEQCLGNRVFLTREMGMKVQHKPGDYSFAIKLHALTTLPSAQIAEWFCVKFYAASCRNVCNTGEHRPYVSPETVTPLKSHVSGANNNIDCLNLLFKSLLYHFLVLALKDSFPT